MAHISGLVAAAEQNSPFEYCDVVTTTTHKTLRGPRAGLIFFRKDKEADLEARVNAAVFPACQGGPHNNTIAGIAVALKQAADPAFKEYAKQVRANAAAMAGVLFKHGYRLQTDGTENHLILWDLRPIGLTGSKIEKICDAVHITLNKNAVAGDTSALVPGGVRIGTSALTSRSMKEQDVEKVAEFLHRVVQIALKTQEEAGSKLLKDFVKAYESGSGEAPKLVAQLKEDVKNVSSYKLYVFLKLTTPSFRLLGRFRALSTPLLSSVSTKWARRTSFGGVEAGRSSIGNVWAVSTIQTTCITYHSPDALGIKRTATAYSSCPARAADEIGYGKDGCKRK